MRKSLLLVDCKDKVLQLLKIIEEDPLQYPPDYELLKGDLQGLINKKRRNAALLV